VKRTGRRMGQAPDLDLVPILNLVSLIIPFLLLGAQFVTIAVIPSVLAGEGTDTDAPTGLGLTLTIAPEGYVVRGDADAVRRESLGDTLRIPCSTAGCPDAAAYDTAGLNELLSRVKLQYPKETTVVVVPYPQIPFEVLTATLDAARDRGGDPLFPDAVIATSSPGDAP
jgi:biopolymer transport protein TolR